MKLAIWEASSGALMALLFPADLHVDRAFAYFDLYTITPVAGPVLRYAAADCDVSYDGNTWSSKLVRVDTEAQRATAHWKIGLDVDTWQVMFYPRPIDEVTRAAYPDTIGSVPWLAAVAAGALDGAKVTVDRAYFASSSLQFTAAALTPVGVLRVFAGVIAEVDLGRSGAAISINSHLELLGVQFPRNVYQASCRHMLFDSGCTLSAATYATDGTADADSTRFSMKNTTLTAPAGFGTYALGKVVMTSGANEGLSRQVRAWDGTTWTFITPFYYDLAPGDTFTAYPGCNKTLATCIAVGNEDNYGGEPFVPAPEAAA